MRTISVGKRPLLLAGLAGPLLAAGLQAQTSNPPGAPSAPRQAEIRLGWHPEADETRPMFTWTVDSVTALLGLPRLRNPGALGGARREVRLWMGFGIGSPGRMMRVVDGPGGVSGEVALWWPGEQPLGTFTGSVAQRREWEERRRSFARRMRADLAEAGCTESRWTAALETCRFTVPEHPDWGAILARIDELDPWTLANPATLSPPLRGGLDGTTLVVEVRDGDRYRSYAYWCSSRFDHIPEARRATRLGDLFDPFMARWQEMARRRFDEQQRQARPSAEGTR